MMKTEM